MIIQFISRLELTNRVELVVFTGRTTKWISALPIVIIIYHGIIIYRLTNYIINSNVYWFIYNCYCFRSIFIAYVVSIDISSCPMDIT